jgi:hypothetical protein
VFSYDGNYSIYIHRVKYGKEAGACLSDEECYSGKCLICPSGMKMIISSTSDEPPENMTRINIEVREPGIFSMFVNPQKGHVDMINPTPDHGFCTGFPLPTPGPPMQEYINSVHQAYIDNNILEPDDPFVWGPQTLDWHGGRGYCIGEWNNNKYMSISARSGEEKYLDLVKEALTQDVSENYFNEHVKLVSFNRATNLDGSIKDVLNAVFDYSIGEYIFSIAFYNNLEINASLVKSEILSQQRMQEIEELLQKKVAFNKLKSECLPTLEESKIKLLSDGSIEMEGLQTISFENNECKFGRLNLQTGDILECVETHCYVSESTGSTYIPPKENLLTLIINFLKSLFGIN